MPAETSRTLVYSVRKLVIQPINASSGNGVPIVVDTMSTVDLKFETVLDEARGGSYLLPLALDPKEMKIELTGKLLDCPPALAAIVLAASYSKTTTPGPSIDSVNNVVGTSVGSRVSAAISGGGQPASSLWAIAATGAQTYIVYNMQTGLSSTPVSTSTSSITTDTSSIPGVTLTIAASAAGFTIGDTANLEVVNVGAAGGGEPANMETVLGPTAYPVNPPQCLLICDAVRKNVVYQWVFYWAVLHGLAVPLGAGKYAMPDFGATVQQPPPFSVSQIPYRWRRIA